MLTEEQIADGWIAHDGGPCPLPRYEVTLRDGRIMRCSYAGSMYWPWHDEPYQADIIAYRKELPDAR